MFWGGEVFRGYEQLFKLGDIGNLCGRNRMYRPIYPIAKEHYSTQWLSFLIALVLLAVTTAATGGWMQPWTVWALVPLNALLVSLASNGAVDAMRAMKGNKTS